MTGPERAGRRPGRPGAARLRDRDVRNELLAALTSAPDAGGNGFHDGARDALRWLVERGPGPLTGTAGGAPVTAAAVVRELAAAQELMYGPPSPGRDYAAGLEHALMWACLATPAPPPTSAPTHPPSRTRTTDVPVLHERLS